MTFEWDANKNTSNIKKHGVDFKDITSIFSYPMLTKPDTRAEYGEERLISMGIISQSVLVVVFTKRNDSIRIISARKANKKEKIIYYERIKK